METSRFLRRGRTLVPYKKDYLNHSKVSGTLEGSSMTDPKFLESAIHMAFWLKWSVCRFRRFFKLFISTFLTWLGCIRRSVKFENNLFSKKLYIASKALNKFPDKFKTLRVEYPSFSVHSSTWRGITYCLADPTPLVMSMVLELNSPR